jgi:hypothetical protein
MIRPCGASPCDPDDSACDPDGAAPESEYIPSDPDETACEPDGAAPDPEGPPTCAPPGAGLDPGCRNHGLSTPGTSTQPDPLECGISEADPWGDLISWPPDHTDPGGTGGVSGGGPATPACVTQFVIFAILVSGVAFPGSGTASESGLCLNLGGDGEYPRGMGSDVARGTNRRWSASGS